MLRFLLVLAVIAVVGLWLAGYLGSAPRPWLTGTPGTAASDKLEQARQRGAELSERAAAATSKAEAALNEAALTAKIKAKMALDDLVKARAIDVTTEGTTVTLRGSVASQAERERALSLARETAGVTRVVDELTTAR